MVHNWYHKGCQNNSLGKVYHTINFCATVEKALPLLAGRYVKVVLHSLRTASLPEKGNLELSHIQVRVYRINDP